MAWGIAFVAASFLVTTAGWALIVRAHRGRRIPWWGRIDERGRVPIGRLVSTGGPVLALLGVDELRPSVGYWWWLVVVVPAAGIVLPFGVHNLRVRRHDRAARSGEDVTAAH